MMFVIIYSHTTFLALTAIRASTRSPSLGYGIRAPADVVAIIEQQEQKTDFICDAVRFYHAHLMKKNSK